MSSRSAFHTQLASIMEVLANAAVAEICRLVDDGYAELRLEMCRCKTENRELRRRLQMAGCGAASGVDPTPADEEAVLREQLDFSFREDPQAADGAGTSPLRPILIVDQEDTSDLSKIKKEMLEEDLPKSINICGQSNFCMEGPETDVGESLTDLDSCASTTRGTEVFGDLDGTGAMEVSGLEAGLMDQTLQHLSWGEGVSGLACEFTVCQRAGHLGSCFTPGSSGPEPGDGSNAADMDSESLSTQTVPPIETSGASSLSPLSAPEFTPEAVKTDLALIKKEDESLGDSQYAPQRRDDESKDREGVLLGDPGPDQRHLPVLQRFNGHHKFSTGKKRLGSKFCWKDFKCQGHLERGDRAHKGEKSFSSRNYGKLFTHCSALNVQAGSHAREGPSSCTQCGKSFMSSMKLKKHQSTHKRERPFACLLCGKCFVCPSQLKVHQYVHTGEKPFGCLLCGRSFSHPSNLKRHQKHYHRDYTL